MTYPLLTRRLTLRPFDQGDLPEFSRLLADPDSMVDHGLTLSSQQSAERLENYLVTTKRNGIGRLHASDRDGFVGYVGIMGHGEDHPLGHHYEIGWRLLPHAWGKGYATEAAPAAFADAFNRLDTDVILAYTAADNLRSQAVMQRLGLTRDPTLDFEVDDELVGLWAGLVWCAHRADWADSP